MKAAWGEGPGEITEDGCAVEVYLNLPSIGKVDIGIERVVRRGDLADMSIRYTIGDRVWKQHFTARLLDDDDVRAALVDAGFSGVVWIDSRWGAAS